MIPAVPKRLCPRTLLQSVKNCDSHFPDGKIKATSPRAAELESCCSGSEVTLLSPLLHSHEASEPAGSEEPKEGVEECQCHLCAQGETWRLRKQLGQWWERPSESGEGPEQRRNRIPDNEEAWCSLPGGEKMMSNPKLTILERVRVQGCSRQPTSGLVWRQFWLS